MTEYEAVNLFPYRGTGTSAEAKDVLRRLLDSVSHIPRDRSLAYMSESELLEMLNSSEKLSVSLRQALASKWLIPTAEATKELAYVPKSFRKLPVSVEMEQGILTVHCPPTLLRHSNDSWVLADCVKAALESFCLENGRPVIPQPAYVICMRKAAGYRAAYRDNENFESSRIINAVMECLGYTDRPDHLGYVSVFRTVKDASGSGVDFIFLSAQKLMSRADLLAF